MFIIRKKIGSQMLITYLMMDVSQAVAGLSQLGALPQDLDE